MATDALIRFPRLAAALQGYAEALKEAYRQNLIQSDRLASEQLLNSVDCEVRQDGTAIVVSVAVLDYWKYVEYDTRPHWPPPDALLRWIRVKPVLPRPMKDGRLPSERQLAYLIGRKISQVGTKGSHDLGNALSAMQREWEQKIAEAAAADIVESWRAVITFVAR